MRVCLISTEILGWGKAGGFGFATRALGKELVKRGHQVTVVLPRPRGADQDQVMLDGIAVKAYPRFNFALGQRLFKQANADVYHSQEPSLGTWLAQRAMPERVHLVTSRDPRMAADWLIEMRQPTYSPLQVFRTMLYYENWLTREGVRGARKVFVPAHFLKPVVRAKYRLKTEPEFMPTPITVPQAVEKAAEPTVCFIGRLDRRKQPEDFLKLAPQFPEVKFIAVGESQDPEYAAHLQKTYGNLPNLEMTGFINQFTDPRLSQILGASWVMVNTSSREGLPNSYIEACAHRTAVLSGVNPDEFATRFGAHVPDRDFAGGLKRLLEGGEWQKLGLAGHAYVMATNEAGAATDAHLRQYTALVEGAPSLAEAS